MSDDAFAARAARKYLEAYDRQNGVAYTVGCAMKYYSNLLGKISHQRGEAPTSSGVMWWGELWRRYATHLVDATSAAKHEGVNSND